MRLPGYSPYRQLAAAIAAVCTVLSSVTGLPTTGSFSEPSSFPVAIWHGLGDRYDSPDLASLAEDIRQRYGPETYVYMIRTNEDGGADSKETLFGNMNSMLAKVADDLKALDELKGGFDAIGLSQGGVFMRAYVERYGLEEGYPKVRNLITLGSPHLGISSSPPCKPTEFFCKATEWALRTGVWTSYAQSSVVPAQYFRNQAKIDEYLAHDSLLKDINNERANDTQPRSGASLPSAPVRVDTQANEEPKNISYKKAFANLNNFVTFAFSQEMTVIPWTSPLFTLPTADDSTAPLAYTDLPLYQEDYIGLRELDEKDGFHQDACHGQHMQISDKCWNSVLKWLGSGGRGRGPRKNSSAPSQGQLQLQGYT